ncbi:hypothetical protein [uncultured Brevundimonas sp.]|uniref:hypothetical protein n=1 Tax=uncultured Brevundimonas sp. TaxID=213418 RepID=UPI0030EDB102
MTDTAARKPIAWPMLIRKAHLFLGMLIAPSVLLFAITGGLQIFRLQESHEGYTPPPIVEKLGRMHMDQVYALKKKRAEPAAAPAETVAAPVAVETATPEPKPAPPLSKQLLQWFFTLVAVGLVLSTLLGVWMGAMVSRSRVTARWLLLAGVVLPVLMLLV